MIRLCSCNAAREHQYCAKVLIEMLALRNSRSIAARANSRLKKPHLDDEDIFLSLCRCIFAALKSANTCPIHSCFINMASHRSCQVLIFVVVVALWLQGPEGVAAGGNRRLLQATPGFTFPGFPGLPAFPIPTFFPPMFPSPSGSGSPSTPAFPGFPRTPGTPNPTVPNAPFPGFPRLPGTPNPSLPNAPAAPAFTPPIVP